MEIAIMGVGALGSNLTSILVPDLKGKHKITIIDKDTIEERNVSAGTQFYSPDQVGMSKVEALQYNCYKWFRREIQIIGKEVAWDDGKGQIHPDTLIQDFIKDGLIVDCFDNHEARLAIQDRCAARHIPCIHIGFSKEFTFAIEWAKNYKVPTDILGFDICEAEGAAGFIKMVAGVSSLVIQEYLKNGTKLEAVGNRFGYRLLK